MDGSHQEERARETGQTQRKAGGGQGREKSLAGLVRMRGSRGSLSTGPGSGELPVATCLLRDEGPCLVLWARALSGPGTRP